MKRALTLFTVLALCLSLLSACGKAQSGGSANTPAPGGDQSAQPSHGTESAQPGESSQPAQTPSQAPSQAPSEEPSQTPSPSEAPENSAAPTLTLSMSDAVITYAGYVLALTPTFSGTQAAPLTWTSSDASVASVDSQGNVTSLAPGKTVISAETADGLRAECVVRCSWSSSIDLTAFAQTLFGRYEFSGSITLVDAEITEAFYAGLSAADASQLLVYLPQMSLNMGELVLVEAREEGDVDAIKAILQARIDYMAGDGNGPGGAWYPEAMESWELNSRLVSSGKYVMMVVNDRCDDIVNDFKALF